MTNHEPPSGYNLPPGCFEHDIDAYFGEGKTTCAECKAMVEFCCDYGICDREYCRARDAEFGSSDSQTNSSIYDVAEWALLWMPEHMRDMQSVACEYFE
ncbi:hypothetical protein [Collinsella sp. HCP28S3_H5]|uniref:hypothetical protein n=1 Tax=unclassified Collinsella TaxID=2637548 RepID=UPI003F8C913D